MKRDPDGYLKPTQWWGQDNYLYEVMAESNPFCGIRYFAQRSCGTGTERLTAIPQDEINNYLLALERLFEEGEKEMKRREERAEEIVRTMVESYNDPEYAGQWDEQEEGNDMTEWIDCPSCGTRLWGVGVLEGVDRSDKEDTYKEDGGEQEWAQEALRMAVNLAEQGELPETTVARAERFQTFLKHGLRRVTITTESSSGSYILDKDAQVRSEE